MEMRQIGTSTISVSPYTLGCMSLSTDEKHAKSIIDYALSNGINHLDTADLYDFGMNEELIGNIIKERRKEIILTSKVGNHFNKKDKTWFWDPRKQYIEEAVHASLKRLQTDYIDLYLLHGGTIDDPIDETIEAFENLKEKGLIRAYGISSIRPNVIRSYLKHSSIDAIMMQYSILDRRPEMLLDDIHQQQVSVLARGPLAKGLLTSNWPSVLHQKAADGYLDYNHLALEDTLTKLDRRFPDQLTGQAIHYLLSHPALASVVFGASSVQQIRETIEQVNKAVLTKEDIKFIQSLTKENIYTAHI